MLSVSPRSLCFYTVNVCHFKSSVNKKDLNPIFMKNIFTEREVQYNLRSQITWNC